MQRHRADAQQAAGSARPSGAQVAPAVLDQRDDQSREDREEPGRHARES